jgi:hypothetical protein
MIYFLDNDAKIAASYLADRHLSPLLCNTCTVICTILSNYGIEVPQKTIKPNTLTNWASLSKGNFTWIKEYAVGLSEAFELRYGKRHLTSIDLKTLKIPEDLPRIKITEFPQMIPDRFKLEDNPIEAYRNFYVHEKAKVSDYKNEPPVWFLNKLNEAERTLWMDFFEQFGCSLRLYRDKKMGVVLQKQLDNRWVTLQELSVEEQVLIERILDVSRRER